MTAAGLATWDEACFVFAGCEVAQVKDFLQRLYVFQIYLGRGVHVVQ